MKVDLRNNKDFFAGLLMLAVGAGGFFMALDYPFGTAVRMGPGYFPRVLAGILMAFGLFVLIRGILTSEKVTGKWGWKALAFITVSLVAFGFVMDRYGLIPALIMLAGVYYGSQYGGSTTSILVNLPGETASVVTCLDGYQMARQGRAGPALAIAAIGSFFAGCVGTLLIAVAGPPIAEIAFKFGAAEYFSMMLMALIAASCLAHGDTVKSLAMVFLGLLLGIIGTDVNSGMARYSFGIAEFTDGIGFTVIAVGLFAISEIVKNLESGGRRSTRYSPTSNISTRQWMTSGYPPALSYAARRSARSSALCPGPGPRSLRSPAV